MKKILKIITWTLLLGGFSTLIGFMDVKNRDTLCRDLRITIDYGGSDKLITQEDIRELIYRLSDTLAGQKLKAIDCRKLEDALGRHVYLKEAQVYTTINGLVNVRVKQRTPVVRIMNTVYPGFYLDDEGIMMPLNPGLVARVVVARGSINEICLPGYSIREAALNKGMNSHVAVGKVYAVAEFIHRDSQLRSLIDQIYVNDRGEIELIPVFGRHTIIFGEAGEVEAKFAKLKVFYRNGLTKIGWDKYSIINLKYRDQVVCTKK
jgi:cell division protein FtsQ